MKLADDGVSFVRESTPREHAEALHAQLAGSDAEAVAKAADEVRRSVRALLYARGVAPDVRRQWLRWLALGTAPDPLLTQRRSATAGAWCVS